MSEEIAIPDYKNTPRDKIKQFWEAILLEFEQSGMSLARFSAKKGLPVHRLTYWRMKLNDTKSQARVEIKQTPTFVPVRLLSPSPSPKLSIHIGKNSRLELPINTDERFVKMILLLLMEQ